MKAELKISSNKKEYYDEMLQAASKCKSIEKYPHRKIGRLSKTWNTLLIAALILIAWQILLLVIFKPDSFDFVIFGIDIMLLLVIIVMLINTNQKLKFYLSNEGSGDMLTSNKDGIEFKDSNKTFVLKWDNIKYVIAYKYSICFMPVELPGLVAAIPVENKDIIIKVLEKHKKTDLFIDNTELYK